MTKYEALCTCSKHALVYSAVSFCMLLYAIWAFLAKAAMGTGASPFIFAFYRIAGGTVLLFFSLIFTGCGATLEYPKGLKDAFGREDFPRFCLLGVCMVFNIYGFILAASYLPAMTCSIFQPTIPVVAMLLSVFWGVEIISWNQVGGVLFSMAGAMIVVLSGYSYAGKSAPQHGNLAETQLATDQHDGTSHSLKGFAFVFLNVSSVALYFVLLKAMLRFYHPTVATAMSYLPAAGIGTLVALTTAGFDKDMWMLGYSHTCWMAAGYAVIFTTAFNYSVMAWATKETTATTTTVFTTLQPIWAALLSLFVLGHPLSSGQAIGGCSIVVGLLLSARSRIGKEDEENKALLPGPSKLASGALIVEG